MERFSFTTFKGIFLDVIQHCLVDRLHVHSNFIYFSTGANCYFVLPNQETVGGGFQCSQAALRETYLLWDMSSMISSASSTFVAAQAVFFFLFCIYSFQLFWLFLCTLVILVPVIEKAGQLGGIISVAFSPVDSTHVAIGGGSKGGKTIDIRQPNQ